jgi:hypothetical protein
MVNFKKIWGFTQKNKALTATESVAIVHQNGAQVQWLAQLVPAFSAIGASRSTPAASSRAV